MKKPKLGTYSSLKKKIDSIYDPNKKYIKITKDINEKYNFIDLFCGAGGITQGFVDAGFNPISSVEINEIASATHIKNFPNCKHYTGDIEKYCTKDFVANEKIHVVTGGPPCQGFSVAGKRDPNDPRNKLFREFVRVVGELQPEYFVMENVPGILTIQNGEVRKAIIDSFAEIGYSNVSVAILEAAHYGVAQFRSRAIFIGNKNNLPNPFPAPMLTNDEYIPIEDAIKDLPQFERVPKINHEWTKHSKDFEKRISKVKPGNSLYDTYADAFKRQYLGVPSMTIKENHGGTHIHPTLNRCISAREMARLQSFPDKFIFEGSMKKAMWQIGNAVPPKLAEMIAVTLKPFIKEILTGKKSKNMQEVIINSEIEKQRRQKQLFN